MPNPAYYAAVNEFYRGQYRDAERAFQRMTRSGVQAGQARWIDAICYHAMYGEVLYHEGRNAEALQAFDQACLMLLTYPDFLKQVRFDDPRPEANPSRAQAPWGPGTRPMALGDYPQTMPVAVGSITGANEALQRGGTFLQAQYWRVNVTEVIRAAALAMRRRNELLGPLAKYDRISKELATTMSRSDLAPANHWSLAWTELLAGIAKAGIGDAAEAKTRLDRALVVSGTFDHPLTGVALLGAGEAGDGGRRSSGRGPIVLERERLRLRLRGLGRGDRIAPAGLGELPGERRGGGVWPAGARREFGAGESTVARRRGAAACAGRKSAPRRQGHGCGPARGRSRAAAGRNAQRPARVRTVVLAGGCAGRSRASRAGKCNAQSRSSASEERRCEIFRSCGRPISTMRAI